MSENIHFTVDKENASDKWFFIIPLLSDLLPFIVLLLNGIFSLGINNLDQQTFKLIVGAWIFFPAVAGVMMIGITVWYFVVWKTKSFSRYAILGIVLSVIGCIEPIGLANLLLSAFRNI